MSLVGWSQPQSDTGRAALVPPPPWHFSAELLTVDFVVDRAAAARFLPPGMDPALDGAASFVAGDWSSAADGDPRVQRDPTRGQYSEAYVVLHGTLAGRPAGRVVAMWVDSDLSLARGLVQGFPKKLGAIAMTRAVALGRGGPRKAAGERFAAHVSGLGRELAAAEVALERNVAGEAPRGIATPLVLTRHVPDLAGGPPRIYESCRNELRDFAVGETWVGEATLRFGRSPYEELEALEPRDVTGGALTSVAFSVVGTRAIPEGDGARSRTVGDGSAVR
jgi:acetoacetate decarboxylase